MGPLAALPDGPNAQRRTPHAAIYYVCPDSDVPSGGIRIIYRHVDILCAAGWRAAVIHQNAHFRCSWFTNDTPTLSREQCAAVLDPARDLLVIPEVCGPDLAALAPLPYEAAPIVIFNQNAYYTFEGYSDRTAPTDLCRMTPYRQPTVRGALVISPDTERYLRYAFPHLRVRRITDAIDPALFYANAATTASKEPIVTYMPRKAGRDARQVLHLLAQRGALAGIQVQAISGQGPAEVAALLRRSALFLCFSGHEGYPLPPREAMACGCAVVGYDGFGGRSFFDRRWAVRVPQGDVQGFARAAERLLGVLRGHPDGLQQMGARAAAHAARTWTPAREQHTLLRAMEAFTHADAH